MISWHFLKILHVYEIYGLAFELSGRVQVGQNERVGCVLYVHVIA
jgi:hypothetical protein